MLSQMKRLIPWWGKIVLKIMLSRLPFAYGAWKCLSLFEHGAMDSPDYALSVFNRRVSTAKFEPRLRGAVVLELGPGDSLFVALIACAYGAQQIYLVDVDDYCERNMAPYNAMAQKLADMGMDIRPDGGFRDFEHMLKCCNAEYLIDGVKSLKEIPSACVDFILSQAVLEHVREGEFGDAMAELRRITKDDGVGSHEVDLADHLGGALNNLRFSRKIWEAPLFAEAGFYTNRIRYSQMLNYFQQAGFETDVVRVENWDAIPTQKKNIAKPYSDLSDEELLVKVYEVILLPAR